MPNLSSSLALWAIAICVALATLVLLWVGLRLRQIGQNLWLLKDLKALLGLTSITDSIRELKASLSNSSFVHRPDIRTPSTSQTTELHDLSSKVGRVGEHAANMTGHLQEIDRSLQIIAKRLGVFLQASSIRPVNESTKQTGEFAEQDMEIEILQIWHMFWTSENGNLKGDLESLKKLLRRQFQGRLEQVYIPEKQPDVVTIKFVSKSTEYVVPLKQTYNENNYFSHSNNPGAIIGTIEDLLHVAKIRNGELVQRGDVTLKA